MSLLVGGCFQVYFLVSFSFFTVFKRIWLESLKDTVKGDKGDEAVSVTIILYTSIYSLNKHLWSTYYMGGI